MCDCGECVQRAKSLFRIATMLDCMADEEHRDVEGIKSLADTWRLDAELLRELADEYDHGLRIEKSRLKVGV